MKFQFLNLLLFIGFITMIMSSCFQGHTETESINNHQRPNIIFILADDLGWSEIGFNNPSKKHTPNIDKLRADGLSLTQFYVHAVCTPSRAAFLTGRYPFRSWSDWRPEDFGKPSYLDILDLELAKDSSGADTRRIHGLPTEERTIAEALKQVGYFTAIAGKWGCGEWLKEQLPHSQGFDHQYGHYAWGIDYNNYTIPHNSPARYAVYDWHRNEQPLYEQGYATDLIANEVVRLLSNHEKSNGNQPFFYYVPFNAIHGPLEEIPRYVDKLGKRHAAIKCLDEAVGRIVGAVDQYGYGSNTMVVFTNDNGAIRDTMNVPYRGTKNTNYEGGVRAPCIIKWKGKVTPGSSNNELIHITDFYSTLVLLGGGSLNQELPLDGMDMTEVIFNQEKSPRDEIVFEVSGSVRFPAIRKGNYKLIGEELYDISIDPYEKNDIASQKPEIKESLWQLVSEKGSQRPPMPDVSLVMNPSLPWVYGQEENRNAPVWVKELVDLIRIEQPQKWAPGKTPWPKAPIDGKINYTGDGR